MSMFPDRLQKIMDERGLSQAELGRRTGLSRQAINGLLAGDSKAPRPENLLLLCEALDVDPYTLMLGRPRSAASKLADGTVVPDPHVPLISWVQAGSFTEANDWHPAGHADRYVACSKPHGPQTYALTIVGDSMEPDFIEGDIVFVDPSREAKHGDVVIVRTPDARTTIKRFQQSPEGAFLLVANPTYTVRRIDVPEGTVFAGVVIGKYREEPDR